MKNIETFTDERLSAWCIHCQSNLIGKPCNRDHVPSKTLLRQPYPANIPVIEICVECNASFSTDEEYLTALLESILAGTTSSDFLNNPRVRKAFDNNPTLRRTIERCKLEYDTRGGEKRILWRPDWKRVYNVLIKNARGHAYFEIGEPLFGAPDLALATPLITMTEDEIEKFETPAILTNSLLPEVGSRMLTRVFTRQDMTEDGWIVVQDGIYRYAVTQTPYGIDVRTVLQEYLATHVVWKT